MDLDRKELFMRKYGVKLSSGHICIQRLLGKTCKRYRPSPNYGYCDCQPPGTDHQELWIRDGKPVLFTSQPYNLDFITIRRMIVFADEHQLEFYISSWESWWNPSACPLIVWKTKSGE